MTRQIDLEHDEPHIDQFKCFICAKSKDIDELYIGDNKCISRCESCIYIEQGMTRGQPKGYCDE